MGASETVEKLEGLRRRVEGADSLRAIARVMRTLSAVRIRRSREAAEAVAEYERSLELSFQVALAKRPAGIQPAVRAAGRLGTVVFGSDLGLAGQYNARIGELAIAELSELPAAELGPVLAVGTRVASYLEASGIEANVTMPAPGDVERLAELAHEVALVLERWRDEENIERISVFHNRYLSGAAYRPRHLKLLPLDEAWLEDLEHRSWPTRMLPDSNLAWDDLLGLLVREYLFVALVRAAAESMASEHASRLLAMETALRRIDEHREELAVELRDLRHARITEELLDVAAGYEALTRPGGGA